MEYGLQDSGAKIVFCDEERNSVLTPLVDKLKITLIHTNLGLFNEVVALGTITPALHLRLRCPRRDFSPCSSQKLNFGHR